MESYIQRRVIAYTLMAGIIIIIGIVGNNVGSGYIGKSSPVYATLNIGKVNFIINSTNFDNIDNSYARESDNIKTNITVTNGYNEIIKVNQTEYVLFDQKYVYNTTTTTLIIPPLGKKSIIFYASLDHSGVNYIAQDFIVYHINGTWVGWNEESSRWWTVSQDLYYNIFFESLVLKFMWAPSIPIVIISVKEVIDIWYKRYQIDYH